MRPISPLYDVWRENAEAAHASLGSITKQNIQARLRGMVLMEYSNQDPKGLVLSTGNKTEVALGYSTLYGDMCGGLAVLADVSKERVYKLAEELNHSAGREVVLRTVIERVPTAELEEGQSDRANLPADYPILSPLVDRIIEDNPARGVLVEELRAREVENPEMIVDSTRRMIARAEYKRRQGAPGFKVTKKAFGAGRRYPI